jgi:hypothetical protein
MSKRDEFKVTTADASELKVVGQVPAKEKTAPAAAPAKESKQ